MKRAIFVLAAALLCACAAAAQPEAPPADPAAAVRACLAAHADAGDDARACIGAVDRACADSFGDGGATTAARVVCVSLEADAWRAERDRLAALARAQESESQRALLDQALAQGESWMQARCAYAASAFEGGTFTRVAHALCLRDSLAEQTLDLHLRDVGRD